jgi:hypothetical protein
VRTLALALMACLVALSSTARAQTAPAPAAPAPVAAPARAAEAYAARKKSLAVAETLEALSPIAGMGAFYAHDNERGTILAVMSTIAAGAGVGSVFWLVHLSHQQESGFNRTVQDFEQGTALSILVTAGIFYLVTRVSGFSLAVESTDRYNEELRNGLGLPPPEAVVPSHALAPGVMLPFRF